MKNRIVLLFSVILLVVFVVVIKYINTNLSESTYPRSRSVLDNKTVVVKIFYECLCPDSRHFIVRQLVPSYQQLQRANLTHLVDFRLIPYGKASTRDLGNGNYAFTCQHGEPECILNRIHACAIDQDLPFSKLLEMVKCSISNPPETTDSCGMSECPKGDILLKQHGIETNRLSPSISFVPTITIDNSQSDQSEILRNFHNVLVERLTA